ncbi:hypothetical protein D3C80_1146900 [compost metagenome]
MACLIGRRGINEGTYIGACALVQTLHPLHGIERKHHGKHQQRQGHRTDISAGKLKPLDCRVLPGADVLRAEQQQARQAQAHADTGGHRADQRHRHHIQQGQ